VKDYSKMIRIPTNPVKALHIADFEDLYWTEMKQRGHGARRALYGTAVDAHVLVLIVYFFF